MSQFLTLTKLRDILEKLDIHLTKSLGQNFLIDRNVRNKILEFAELEKTDTIIEIGAGLGQLTDILVEKTGKVYAFEIEEKFCKFLKRRYSFCKNFYLFCQDYLQISPQLFSRLKGKVKVIGNLPYYIASPIIFDILKNRKKVKLALFTVQKEFGERLVAGPGSKNYGILSVLINLYTETKICYSLKRHLFYPQPDVDSVVILICPLSEPRIFIKDEKKFWKFLPLIFSYRRKKIINVINIVWKEEKEYIDKKLRKSGINPNIRVEQLESEKIYEVFKVVQNLLSGRKKWECG